MFKLSQDLYDYEVHDTFELVDDAIFHEDTLIPKEIFLSEFDLLPKFSDKSISLTFSSENTGLQLSNGTYNGVLQEADYTYQEMQCIQKHKFYINNIVRNNFTKDLNDLENFDKNCKTFFNSITMISQFKLVSENDDRVLQDFIKKYLNIIRLINESIDFIKKYGTERFDEYEKKVESITPLMREIVDSELLQNVIIILYNTKIRVKVSLKNAKLKSFKVMESTLIKERTTKIQDFICDKIEIAHIGKILDIMNCKCDSITTFSAQSNNTNALLFYDNTFNVLNFQNKNPNLSLAFFKNNKINRSIISLGCDYVYFDDVNVLKHTIVNNLKQEIDNRNDSSYLNVDFSDDVKKTFLNTINNLTIEDGQWGPPTDGPILRLPPAMTAMLKMDINIADFMFQYKLDLDNDYELIYKLIQFLIK
jgi:hypothetical protein